VARAGPQLAQWAVAVHKHMSDVMNDLDTTCHVKVNVDYQGFHLPAFDEKGELCELRDLPSHRKARCAALRLYSHRAFTPTISPMLAIHCSINP
jgi:hypothetical protein